MQANILTLSTAKSIGFLLPSTILLFGGILIWKSRQRMIKDRQTQSKLLQQLEQLKAELFEIKNNNKVHKKSIKSFKNSIYPDNNPKKFIFEKLIHDNVELRKGY